MFRLACIFLFSVLCLSSFLGNAAYAAEKGSIYLGFRGGTYNPGGELEDDEFNSGEINEFFFGYFPARNLAVEAAGGHLETRSTGIDLFPSDEEEIEANFFTTSIKGVLPFSRVDLAASGGIGAYFVRGRYEFLTAGDTRESDTDHDTVMGYHLAAEATIHFTRSFFLLIEDRFIRTGDAELEYNIEGNRVKRRSPLNGNTVMFSLGFMF